MRVRLRERLGGVALSCGLAAGLILTAAAPVAAASAPVSTGSWYVTQYNTTWAYNQGCSLGGNVLNNRAPQNTIVVLDFMTQYYSGGWGTMGDDKIFHPMSQAQAVAKEFAHGFWYCTGSDSTATLMLVMGTRNIWWPTTLTTSDVAARGTQWANMVTQTYGTLGSYSSQVYLQGGIDAELSWASSDYTLAWAQAYSNVGGSRFYYDYGDAAGCPPYGSCNNGYSQSSVWQLAWGLPAGFVLPEIYTTSGSQASQWQQISLWGVTNGHSKIQFSGSLTQSKACTQRGGCSGTNNSPSAGWTQLYNSINGNSQTAMTPLWSTDMGWDQ